MINLMSFDFEYKASLGGYESLLITRKWNGIDTMEMVLGEIPNADMVALNDILWVDKNYDTGFVVERIEEELVDSIVKRKITALGLTSILADFITVPPSGEYDSVVGTRETVARTWIEHQVDRNPQYPIMLGDYIGLGDSISEQTRFKNLSDEIQRILLPEDLGYNLTIDFKNEQFIFNVLQGIDRTVNAPTYTPRVIFGLEYGNLSEYKRILDISASKNYAFVAGQGEGAARTIVEVDRSSSRKKEVFVDARDIEVVAELEERGSQLLAESLPVDTFEFVTIDRQFKYKESYNLGDYVTIVKNRNESEDLQIREIQEIYEHGNTGVIISFGQSQKDLKKVLGSIDKRVVNLEISGTGQVSEIDGGEI